MDNLTSGDACLFPWELHGCPTVGMWTLLKPYLEKGPNVQSSMHGEEGARRSAFIRDCLQKKISIGALRCEMQSKKFVMRSEEISE